jgi:hypothetical protein
MRGFMVVVIVMALGNSTASAHPLEYMYDEGRLEQERVRYERKIDETYEKVLAPLLTERERRALAGVALDFPLLGQSGTPLDFYTAGQRGQITVFMPVLSLLFLEDLTTAFAWLQVNGYSPETVEEYVTMLKYKEPSAFPGGRYPPPLEALHIPPDALSDKQVDALSLRLRNTAYEFILLHELAHALHRHPGYAGVPRGEARTNEAEADRFALTVLERGNRIPMGAIVFFMVQVNSLPNKGQFIAFRKSEGDWERYLQREATHPLTTDRLNDIALYLAQWADRSGGSEGETLASIATHLAYFAEGYDDPDMQGCLAVVAHRADPAVLAPRRIASKTQSDLMFEHCQKR